MTVRIGQIRPAIDGEAIALGPGVLAVVEVVPAALLGVGAVAVEVEGGAGGARTRSARLFARWIESVAPGSMKTRLPRSSSLLANS